MAAENLTKGAPDGTTLGQSTTEKIGFYGTAPVVQPTTADQATVGTTALLQVTGNTVFGFQSATQAANLIACVNAIRAALVSQGLIKGA